MKKQFWALIVGIWTVLGLFMASQIIRWSHQAGKPWAWYQALFFELSYCALWIGLTPTLVWLCRRFSLIERRWPIHAVVHLVAAVVMSMGTMAVRTIFSWLILDGMSKPLTAAEILQSLFVAMDYGIMSYILILLVVYAYEYYTRLREREVQAAQLESRLLLAQVQSLKMQLQPHFLFNTLHTIANLVRTGDHATAIQMLNALSALLRCTLSTGNQQEIPLEQEIEILQLYVNIQQIRFRDRLVVDWRIAPETLDAQVPNMLLQPLAENAIQHGISPLARPGHLSVVAERTNGTLHLSIADNGKGLASEPHDGIGLSNTKTRLEKLYGGDFRFMISGKPDQGTVVDVWIPYVPSKRPGTS